MESKQLREHEKKKLLLIESFRAVIFFFQCFMLMLSTRDVKFLSRNIINNNEYQATMNTRGIKYQVFI